MQTGRLPGNIASTGRAETRNKGQHGIKLLLLLVLLLLLSACSSTPKVPVEPLRPTADTTPQTWLTQTLASQHPDARLSHPEHLTRLYQQSDFASFWLDPQGQPNAAARLLLGDLQPWLALEHHAQLLPYRQLANLLQQPTTDYTPRQRLAQDILISDLFLTYQQDLLQGYWTHFDQDQDHGVTNAYERWDDWPDEVVRRNLQQVMPRWLALLNTQSPEAWALARIQEARPNTRLYLPWRQAFDELQALQAGGPWPLLDVELKRGDRGMRVTRLAEQLHRQGDLASLLPYLPDENELPLFDFRLEQALKDFQQRHNLPRNGRADAMTRLWLNLPPEERLRRMAHNLRRLHHLPQTLNNRHLMINLADARLQFVENQTTRLDMKVIIGKDGQRTPIMNQWLTSLVLNPLWNVPDSIARDRIIPRARNNPAYLDSRDYALVRGWQTPARYVTLDDLPGNAFTRDNPGYRLVQKTGQYNQLGRAKFRLSNQQAIYLHDTPYRQLFNNTRRDISAGCVRVEDSERLVEALLASSRNGSPEQINAVYAQGEERYLQVRPRVAVYLMYWTAWTDASGRLQWRNDVYYKDQLGPLQQASNR